MRVFDGWCVGLAACYCAVVLHCIVQTARIAYHGHQLRSFRVGFLLLSTAWMALKGIFWLNVQRWSLLGLVVFSELPPCGQMASYLFFLIFCAQHVHRQSWAVQGPRCWLAFALANLATLGSVVGFTITALVERGSDSSAATAEPRKETQLGVIFSAAVYAVLCTSLGIYGWLIFNQRDAAGSKIAGSRFAGPSGGPDGGSALTRVSFKTGFVKKDQKVSGIVPVLFAASAVFLFRTVYDLLVVTRFATPIAIEQDNMRYVVPFYLLTDIFPTLLLLLYFRAIPTKPPRPRHIPSVRPDAKIGLLAAARVDGHGPRLDLNSSVNVEAGGSVQAHKPAVRPLGTTGLAAISKGGTRRSSQAAVVAGSFPAFDPFKSDSGQLPAAFGAPQGGAQSAGSSGGGGGGGGPGQQPSRSSISRV